MTHRQLQETRLRCDGLEEQLAERDERHHLDVSEKHDGLKTELTEQVERVQQDLLEREEVFR